MSIFYELNRFVVVCSFQSGMQTVRASFSVPGRGGVASVEENDPFQPDSDEYRMGRGQRFMKFVDKSGLVLKEDNEVMENMNKSKEIEALVKEIKDNKEHKNENEIMPLKTSSEENTVAILKNIVPGINENEIKHEAAGSDMRTSTTTSSTDAPHYAKYAMLMHEQVGQSNLDNSIRQQNAHESKGNK